jgi:hypothetical protein
MTIYDNKITLRIKNKNNWDMFTAQEGPIFAARVARMAMQHTF